MPTKTPPAEKVFITAEQPQFRWLSAADAGKKLKKFSMTAYTGGAMNVGYGYLVVVDLAGMNVPSQRVPILKDHDSKLIAGHSTEITKQKSSLLLAGMMSGIGDAAKEVLELAANEFPWQASIGAAIEKMEFIDRGETTQANGQKFTGPIYVARQSKLVEVSFVAIGADTSTSASILAKGTGIMPPETAQCEPESPTTVQAMRDQAADLAAERARIDYIEANMTDPRFGQIKAQAIRENWDRKLVDDRVTAASKTTDRPHSPGIHVVNHEVNAQILEASLCKSAGCKEDFIGKQFGEQVTNEALSARHRGLGLHSLMGLVVQAAGMSMPSTRFGNAHIRTAFEANRALQAGFSTVNLPGILGNTANKVLREAWDAVKVVWPLITRKVDAKDFHPFTSYRLTLKGELEQLAADGHIKHGQLIENDTENSLKTYALMLGLTRVDIINDNLNAFMQIPRSFGHLTQTHTEEIVLKTLLSAGAFFSTANGNLLEGTANVLSITGLTNAETLFSKQKDANGKLLLLNAETLLTPAVLKVTAQQLTVQTQLVGTSSSLVPGSNPHAGKFKPVSSPHLDADGPLGGGSDTAWYLFANPSVVAALEIAFLNGQDMPVIESSETDFDTLGMQWRTYYDVGCATGEEQGALKVTGVVAPG